MSNKKQSLDNFFKFFPIIVLLISSFWFLAEMDKRLTVQSSRISVVQKTLQLFYDHQRERNKTQDENLKHFERILLMKIRKR